MSIRILTNSHCLLDPSFPRRRQGAGGTRDTRWGERGHRVPGLAQGTLAMLDAPSKDRQGL